MELAAHNPRAARSASTRIRAELDAGEIDFARWAHRPIEHRLASDGRPQDVNREVRRAARNREAATVTGPWRGRRVRGAGSGCREPTYGAGVLQPFDRTVPVWHSPLPHVQTPINRSVGVMLPALASSVSCNREQKSILPTVATVCVGRLDQWSHLLAVLSPLTR
ncbi:hypothetical protein GCM10025774_13180 [Microbacterium kyungheense]